MPKSIAKNIDWILVLAVLPIVVAGLITMNSFGQITGGEDSGYFFSRQVLWVLIGFGIFFIFSQVDWRFLKSGGLLLVCWLVGLGFLVALFLFGSRFQGAVSWFDLGAFSAQPAELMKLFLILLLAKYFSRRHIEITNFRHIMVSGFYVFLPTVLILLQPDFGSALITALIWLGMIMVSGISKKHLFSVILIGVLIFILSWSFALQPYQKARIKSFINPSADPQGAGYNALQSMIAVGSGGLFGKGIGFGTQSRLEFLPEFQTDFIFAAYAEEWGLLGVSVLFLLFGILIWRILKSAALGQSNFEKLFGIGLAVLIISYFGVHIGMNIGVLPITGVNLPFMSYGGSHLITIFAGLGILMGMRRYSRNIQVHDEEPMTHLLEG